MLRLYSTATIVFRDIFHVAENVPVLRTCTSMRTILTTFIMPIQGKDGEFLDD